MRRHPFPALRAFFGIIVLLALGACASAPPEPEIDYKRDYDFRHVLKFSFYKHSGQVSGDNPMQLSDMQRNRVDEALKLALENRGFTFYADASQADLLVSWHLSTQNKTDVRTHQSVSMGGYGGYYGGYNRYSRYHCWSCAPTHTEVSVRDYTQGNFIVDMIDPNLKQSVWRSVITSRLKGDKGDDQTRYNAAAARIFASFPPL
ncbi:MAG: DUF4136 domain-containing protein [Halieaceae bacterium]|jgi:hypothetical protein|nr:DUF4136 domain-containing protein [Halieaceae bacterium]